MGCSDGAVAVAYEHAAIPGVVAENLLDLLGHGATVQEGRRDAGTYTQDFDGDEADAVGFVEVVEFVEEWCIRVHADSDGVDEEDWNVFG